MVKESLTELGEQNPDDAMALSEALESTGTYDLKTCAGTFTLEKGMVSFTKVTKK